MKKLYTLLFIAATSLTFGQTTITQWNFNAETFTASTGTGTLTLIGADTTNTFATGNDPVTGTTDKALNVSTFPADGSLSGTAGIRANVSTVGYTGITVSYDRKGSNTASKWEQFEYSINGGTTWIVLGNNGGTTTNVGATTVWPTTTYTLPATVNNNANFAIRMVSIFAPTTSAYAPIGTTYGTGGTWRFDNLTIKGATLGVKQNDIAGLNIYPNPVTNGTLYINTDANAERNVAVYDVLGKQVLKVTTSNNAINVANLNAGVYIVKVTEEGKTATRKLVIR